MCVKIWTEIAEERLAENFVALRRILKDGEPEAGGSSSVPPIAGDKSAMRGAPGRPWPSKAGFAVEDGAATELLAVVKANAYGHGIGPCAAVLARAGAKWLGVTDAHEGARVRETLGSAAVPFREQPEILVMSGTAGLAGEAECMVQHGLTAVVWSAEHVEGLGSAARAAGVSVRVHLEVDTGMSRQGVAPERALERMLGAIAAARGLELDGVLTHFASTEVAGSAQTAEQETRFEAAMAQVAASGLRPRWVHVGNSSYIDNETGERASLGWLRRVAGDLGARAMVRSGLALYGHLLPIEGEGVPLAAGQVRPVMTWKTRIIGVEEIGPGARVGYNGTYVAERAMRVALLPVGYADGLRRELSSTNARAGGWVMIRGRRAGIVGRVSMNLTTVDVSGIPEAGAGDEVVLLGEGVTAADHARLAGTIAYEILCGVRGSE